MASMIAATKIKSGLSEYDLLPSTLIWVRVILTNFSAEQSYIKDFFELENKYFPGLQYSVDVVTEEFDYSDEENQDEILRLAE